MRLIRVLVACGVMAVAISCGKKDIPPEEPWVEDPAPPRIITGLDAPPELSRPPNGKLPSELLPPGFKVGD